MNILIKFFKDGEEGAAMVETAISLFTFSLFMLGTMELTNVIWSRMTLNYALADSARYAYVNSSTITQSSLQSYALKLFPVSSGLKPSFTVTIVPNTSVKIQGNLNYTFMMVPSAKINYTSSILQPLPPS